VKLKTADFRILTCQRRLAEPTSASATIYGHAEALLGQFQDPGPFRLVGVAGYELGAAAAETQLDMLDTTARRNDRLDRVLDQVTARFGPGAVRRARDLASSTVLDSAVNLDFLGDEEDGPVGETR